MRRPLLLRAALPFVLPAALLSALWGGCSKEEAKAPPPVVKKTAPAPPAPPALPGAAQPAVAAKEAAKPEGDLFNPEGKRDPFLPYIRPETKASRAERLEEVPPLQRYEVLEYKLVGVIWGPRGYRALIEDRDRKGYTVSVGMRIGRGNGTVARITQNELVVREVIVDSRGKGLARDIALKLQSAGGK